MHVDHRRPGELFAGYSQLEAVVCPTCGVLHAVPAAMLDDARERRGSALVYCPNGHAWQFAGKTDAELLSDERERSARLTAQLDQERASARVERAAAVRARRERDRLGERAKAGVCPCCRRSFRGLAAHIADQHPDYKPGRQ